MGDSLTSSSLLQHLSKVRQRRQEAGKPVPPALPRSKKRKTEEAVEAQKSEEETKCGPKTDVRVETPVTPKNIRKSRPANQEDKSLIVKLNPKSLRANLALEEIPAPIPKQILPGLPGATQHTQFVHHDRTLYVVEPQPQVNISAGPDINADHVSEEIPAVIPELALPGLPGANERMQFVPHDTNPYVVGPQPQSGSNGGQEMQVLAPWGTAQSWGTTQASWDPWNNLQTGFMQTNTNANSHWPVREAEEVQPMGPQETQTMFSGFFHSSWMNPLPTQQQVESVTIDPSVVMNDNFMDGESGIFFNLDERPQTGNETGGGEKH